MKAYGTVKGRIWRNEQPMPDVKGRKRRCGRCGMWRPEGDFKGHDGMPRRWCAACRAGKAERRNDGA